MTESPPPTFVRFVFQVVTGVTILMFCHVLSWTFSLIGIPVDPAMGVACIALSAYLWTLSGLMPWPRPEVGPTFECRCPECEAVLVEWQRNVEDRGGYIFVVDVGECDQCGHESKWDLSPPFPTLIDED